MVVDFANQLEGTVGLKRQGYHAEPSGSQERLARDLSARDSRFERDFGVGSCARSFTEPCGLHGERGAQGRSKNLRPFSLTHEISFGDSISGLQRTGRSDPYCRAPQLRGAA